MAKQDKSGHSGHIMATLQADKILLKYFDKLFDFQYNKAELRRKIMDAAGIADGERVARLKEEIDRLEGLIKQAQKNR